MPFAAPAVTWPSAQMPAVLVSNWNRDSDASAREKQQKWRRESPSGLTELGGYSASVSSSTIGPSVPQWQNSIKLTTIVLSLSLQARSLLNSAPSMDLLTLALGRPSVSRELAAPRRGRPMVLRLMLGPAYSDAQWH